MEDIMLNILKTLVLAVSLLIPAGAVAAEQTGFYVAPKFALNVQHAEGSLSLSNIPDLYGWSVLDI